MTIATNTIATNARLAVILAGGQGLRMEANPSTDHTWPAHKWQQRIEQQPLLDIIIERLSPQVSQLALSGPVSEALADTGLPILSDQLPGFVGPLAGLLSALEWADQRGGQWVLSCPCDSPFLPLDLYSTLYEAVQKHHTPIAIARSQERIIPFLACGQSHYWRACAIP